MKISAKTEYACIAMIELALAHGSGEPVRVRQIADTHGIPSRFLVQILLQLKGAGFVASTRGAAGGYQLARDPADVSLWEMMVVIEGAEAFQGSALTSDSPVARVLAETWGTVARVEREMLAEIRLADLVERTRKQAEHMYYI